MGIKKDKKPKEEYVFDQDDFDKYVEYCKSSDFYLVPKKEDYRSDKIINVFIKMLLYSSFYFASIPTIINSCLFLSALINRTNTIHSGILFIFLAVWMITIQLLDLLGLKRQSKYIKKIQEEINENYRINYNNWLNEIKMDYVENKRKEFNNNLKYKKLKEEELKRVRYWMPSWIYFIIRIIDNDVRYVGQTINIQARKRAHQKKYPKKEYIFEPIERKDISEIDSREYFWIKQFGWNNLDNITQGGSAIPNKKGFKRKDVIYDGPHKDEIERVEKWLEFIKNRN